MLFVQPTANRSGAELSLSQLLEYVIDAKIRAHLLIGGGGATYDLLSKKCHTTSIVKIPKLTRRLSSILKVIFSILPLYLELRKIISAQNIDTIYINTLMVPQVLIVSALFRKCRVIVHVREVRTTYPPILYDTFLCLAGFYANKLVVVCDYIREGQPIRCRKRVHKKSELLYNSSALNPPEGSRKLEGTLRILCVIPITLRKGAFDLVAFSKTMLKIWPEQNFKVHVLGRIDQSDVFGKIKTQIKLLGLGEYFHFHGEVHDMEQHYASAHILLHPSHTEAFPRVIVEALNMALPVVTTDAGGSSEALIEGQTGYVVKVGDMMDMAKKIKYICGSESVYHRQSKAAFSQYTKKFTPKILKKTFLEIIER